MEERYTQALAQALEHLSSDPQTRAVLVFGSVAKGQPHEHSDIDLYALSSRDAFWRICKLFNGVQSETIFGPQKGFERALLSRDAISVQSFALGTPLLDRDGVMPGLTALAKKLYAEGPPPMPSVQCTKYRAIFTRHIQKLAWVPEGSLEALVVAHNAIENVILAFYQHHRMWMNNLSSRVRLIEEKDAAMGQLLKDFYLAGQKNHQASAACQVMMDVLGGPLDEFVSEVVPWRTRPPETTGEAAG